MILRMVLLGAIRACSLHDVVRLAARGHHYVPGNDAGAGLRDAPARVVDSAESPELAAAIDARYPESTMQRGLWNHYGWMLMAALIVRGAILWIKDALAGNAD
jgi:hypothetical protein